MPVVVHHAMKRYGSPPAPISRRATRRVATRQMPQAYPPQRGVGKRATKERKMQGQLRRRLSGGIFGGIDSSVRLEDAKKAAPDVDRGPHAPAARHRPDYPLSGCFPAEPNFRFIRH